MKKLFLVLLVAALAVPALFAETTFSGNFQGSVNAIQFNSDNDPKPTAGPLFGLTRIQLSAQNDEETFGATLRVQGSLSWPYAGGNVYGFGWWQPISQVRVQVGFHDAVFAVNELMGWGFHANDADDIIAAYHAYGPVHNKGVSVGMDDAWAASIQLKPLEALTIGLAVPFYVTGERRNGYWSGNGAQYFDAGDLYKNFQAHLRYQIGEAARIAVSYVGGRNEISFYDAMNRNSDVSVSSIFASVYITAIENVEINVGGQYQFAVADDFDFGTGEKEYKIQKPVIGFLGFGIKPSDAISFKARLAAYFIGEIYGVEDPTTIALDILPCFAIGENLKFYINAGVEFATESDNTKQRIGFGVNPYVTVSAGPGTFYMGVDVSTSDTSDPIVVRIPVGVAFAF